MRLRGLLPDNSPTKRGESSDGLNVRPVDSERQPSETGAAGMSGPEYIFGGGFFHAVCVASNEQSPAFVPLIKPYEGSPFPCGPTRTSRKIARTI